MSDEQWKVISKAPNYKISSNGRIVSILTGKERRGIIQSNGYLRIKLSCNGKKTTYYIHRLVLEAFHGPSSNDIQANHKNFIKTDNRIENLEWCTCQENIIHYVLNNGISNINFKSCKLKPVDIITIREMRLNGVKVIDISKLFHINRTYVYEIINKKHWKHV